MHPSDFEFQTYEDDGSANVFRTAADPRRDAVPGAKWQRYVATVRLDGPEPLVTGLCQQDEAMPLLELAAFVVATTEHVKKVADGDNRA